MENKFSIFNKKNLIIKKSYKNYGFTYFTKRDFLSGEVILKGFGKVIGHQTPHISVQIGKKKHFLPTHWTGRNLNHSCDPNCYVKTRSDGFPDFVALKKIKEGDEITFSYWMTEYEWSKNAAESNLTCLCGSKNCKKVIKSFSQLPVLDRKKFRNLVSDYLIKI